MLTEKQLLAKYEKRIRGLAYKLMPQLLPTVTVDDLMQVGAMALIRVARRFDPSRGVPFGGYLQQRLRGSMMDLLEVEYSRWYSAPRDGDWDPALKRRVHVRADRGADQSRDTPQSSDGLLAQIPDVTGLSPEQIAARAKLAQLCGLATDVLTPREKILVSALFSGDMTLKQAGMLVNLGESRTCQIRADILSKLKTRLASLGVRNITGALL